MSETQGHGVTETNTERPFLAIETQRRQRYRDKNEFERKKTALPAARGKERVRVVNKKQNGRAMRNERYDR